MIEWAWDIAHPFVALGKRAMPNSVGGWKYGSVSTLFVCVAVERMRELWR
jgi:hypothetical protein